MDYDTMAKEFYNSSSKTEAHHKILDYLQLEKFNLIKFESALRENVKHKRQKQHIYLVTYTLDPKKVPEITPEIEKKIVEMIENQGKRTALSIIRYEYVKEYHQNGRPHWHALVVTTKILKTDRFKYFIDKYGNVDISKNKAQNSADIVEYITKTGEIKKII